MRFSDAHHFSVLSSEGVQYEWRNSQVYGVLNKSINVICAVLPLRWDRMSGNRVKTSGNRTRNVSKILLFRYMTISSNFIASNFSSFLWSITKLKPNKASTPVANMLSNIRKTISCGKLEHAMIVRKYRTDQGDHRTGS